MSPPLRGGGSMQCHALLLPLFADAEQSSSPRAGMGSDQEDSKPITLDTTDFQESFVTSGVFSVTELIQVSRTPVVTGTGPNFSLGELQGHLAYDLNPASTGMRRTLPSTSSSGSKRHKSGSMEEDVDTSPGGDYYTSPSSPTSSSRNWTEDMEGGISSPVKKTEMDKSPFNSPSPQDSPRLSSFTQHHRPVIAVHSGIARSPHPSSALHFPTTSILPQTASTYFPHTAIRYPPHLNPQDPLKDLVSLACDPASQQPGPQRVRSPSHLKHPEPDRVRTEACSDVKIDSTFKWKWPAQNVQSLPFRSDAGTPAPRAAAAGAPPCHQTHLRGRKLVADLALLLYARHVPCKPFLCGIRTKGSNGHLSGTGVPSMLRKNHQVKTQLGKERVMAK
ncbi:Nuclear factor 1 C-type [Camelus dromedarius]|uniref:Nuclear factor 1 C-type n=1 Tax=Camelus dromedarius TaxID=9838 RepID=A0A5N4CKH0_CAMDR|nr:Nuclear factor 1 C-type [Camelus dromedarius]